MTPFREECLRQLAIGDWSSPAELAVNFADVTLISFVYLLSGKRQNTCFACGFSALGSLASPAKIPRGQVQGKGKPVPKSIGLLGLKTSFLLYEADIFFRPSVGSS